MSERRLISHMETDAPCEIGALALAFFNAQTDHGIAADRRSEHHFDRLDSTATQADYEAWLKRCDDHTSAFQQATRVLHETAERLRAAVRRVAAGGEWSAEYPVADGSVLAVRYVPSMDYVQVQKGEA